jgi:hypothetical protein
MSTTRRNVAGPGANYFYYQARHPPAKLHERIQWALNDNRPFVVKNGLYVIKPLKMKLPERVTKSELFSLGRSCGLFLSPRY